MRIPHGEWTEDVGVKESKKRRVQAEAERNRADYGDGERGGAAEAAERVPDVLPKRFDGADASGVSTLVLYQWFGAKPDARLTLSFGFRKTSGQILPRLHLEMEGQLVLELPIDCPATYDGAQPKPQIATAHAILKTRLMAAEIRSQSAASVSSCFRPAVVRR